MSNKLAQDWVCQNCRFAAFGQPAPGLSTQRPQPVKSPLAQPADSEDDLPSLRELRRPKSPTRIPVSAIFQRLTDDLKAAKEALSYVGNPNFPTFQTAFKAAFGSLESMNDVMTVVDGLDKFFSIVAQEKKFAAVKKPD